MNGDKVKNYSLILTIAVMLFMSGGLFYVSYDTAKSAKTKSENLEIRMNALETSSARFEGIMNERTRNIQDDVRTINENVMKLLENLELVEGNNDDKNKAQS